MPSLCYRSRAMSRLKRLIATCVLFSFAICSVAWTYDAIAGDDPLMSEQADESNDDGSPLSGFDDLPPLPGGGYCNMGCHLAGHLLGPVPSAITLASECSTYFTDRVFFRPSIRFLEPAVPPPISPSHV